MPDWISPYIDDVPHWLRGNLHTHTTFSDGASPVDVVIARYEAAGYDFLAISDHDLLIPPDRYQPTTGLTLLPADEVTANGPHILAVGIDHLVPPNANRQTVIDETTRQGGIAIQIGRAHV